MIRTERMVKGARQPLHPPNPLYVQRTTFGTLTLRPPPTPTELMPPDHVTVFWIFAGFPNNPVNIAEIPKITGMG